jgi:hypothetical protein
MLPILDGVAERTGWRVTLVAGGPEPADMGRLNVLRYVFDHLLTPVHIISCFFFFFRSIHSGTTSGAVKMNFGRSERVAYKQHWVPSFGRFLKKCYSMFLLLFCCRLSSDCFEAVDECRSRVLPDAALSLVTLDVGEDGATVDSFYDPKTAC